MSRVVLVSVVLSVCAGATYGDMTAGTELIYHGPLTDGTEVYAYELMINVTGDDAWTVAGGPELGEPWITLTGGTFRVTGWYPPVGEPPPGPPPEPDEHYTCLYTWPGGWPNTTQPTGSGLGFAYGPIYGSDALTADWFWTPDGNSYPGYFTIARFTIVPDGPDWQASVNIMLGSRETSPFLYSVTLPDPCPEDLGDDGVIDLQDLALLLGNYGQSGVGADDGDFDGDGDVDLADLSQLLAVYGQDCPTR